MGAISCVALWACACRCREGAAVLPAHTHAACPGCRGNLAVLDWELGPADYAALSTLPFQQRMVNGAMWLVRV